MTRSNRSARAAGTRFETLIATYLATVWPLKPHPTTTANRTAA